MKGFTKGDPRAVTAGRKGGQTMRFKVSPDYRRGFAAGYQAGRRSTPSDPARVQSDESAQAIGSATKTSFAPGDQG